MLQIDIIYDVMIEFINGIIWVNPSQFLPYVENLPNAIQEALQSKVKNIISFFHAGYSEHYSTILNFYPNNDELIKEIRELSAQPDVSDSMILSLIGSSADQDDYFTICKTAAIHNRLNIINTLAKTYPEGWIREKIGRGAVKGAILCGNIELLKSLSSTFNQRLEKILRNPVFCEGTGWIGGLTIVEHAIISVLQSAPTISMEMAMYLHQYCSSHPHIFSHMGRYDLERVFCRAACVAGPSAIEAAIQNGIIKTPWMIQIESLRNVDSFEWFLNSPYSNSVEWNPTIRHKIPMPPMKVLKIMLQRGLFIAMDIYGSPDYDDLMFFFESGYGERVRFGNMLGYLNSCKIKDPYVRFYLTRIEKTIH